MSIKVRIEIVDDTGSTAVGEYTDPDDPDAGLRSLGQLIGLAVNAVRPFVFQGRLAVHAQRGALLHGIQDTLDRKHLPE